MYLWTSFAFSPFPSSVWSLFWECHSLVELIATTLCYHQSAMKTCTLPCSPGSWFPTLLVSLKLPAEDDSAGSSDFPRVARLGRFLHANAQVSPRKLNQEMCSQGWGLLVEKIRNIWDWKETLDIHLQKTWKSQWWTFVPPLRVPRAERPCRSFSACLPLCSSPLLAATIPMSFCVLCWLLTQFVILILLRNISNIKIGLIHFSVAKCWCWFMEISTLKEMERNPPLLNAGCPSWFINTSKAYSMERRKTE